MKNEEDIREAVKVLFALIDKSPDDSDDVFLDGLLQFGLWEEDAEAVFRFAQIAAGRALMGGLGIQFAEDYIVFDEEGEAVGRARLAENSYYQVAVSMIGGATKPAVRRLGLSSSEVVAVNELLLSGSSPGDLIISPPAVYRGTPTEEGIDRASYYIENLMRSETISGEGEADGRSERPWWRFW